MPALTPAELEQVLTNIETQRWELESAQREPASQKSLEVLGMSYAYDALPEKQKRIIAAEIDTAPEDFLVEFMEAMGANLCKEGGVLFEQWQKYRDLDAESLAKEVCERLVKLGFEGQAIATLTEAISVCVL